MILIAEDVVDALDVHIEVISACFPDSLLTARSSAEGVNLAEKYARKIRLLVTDYDLGDGTGSLIARTLKDNGSPATCILITGCPDWVREEERALFQRIAEKPLGLEQFFALFEGVPGYCKQPKA